MNQWELKANTLKRRQARENACDQVAVLVLHLIGWVGGASFFKPITGRSKVNQSNSAITFDTQLKTALWLRGFYIDQYLSKLDIRWVSDAWTVSLFVASVTNQLRIPNAEVFVARPPLRKDSDGGPVIKVDNK